MNSIEFYIKNFTVKKFNAKVLELVERQHLSGLATKAI